ncbi:MAG TPA: maleylpyruvate isomerase N-terminal domain-containing protein [Dehalococcoidia bacterium]|nr:maleylpyruvate isomerase N-terminal domain-containing protein [Dehalococcoidia bacterium]
MSVDKAAVQRELEEAWAELRALVDSVPESEFEQPGVVDGWSLKDLLGHIAFWAEKAAGDLRLLAAGRPDEIETPGSEENVDAWNAREAAARRGKSLKEVREEWLKSFDAARDALRGIEAEKLATQVKGLPQLNRFAGDTYEHYREHAAQVRAWQRQLETTEA